MGTCASENLQIYVYNLHFVYKMRLNILLKMGKIS